MTDNGDPATKSIGDSNSSSNSSSSAKYTTPTTITPSPPSPTSSSPTSTSAYDNSSLVPFTSKSLDDNSNEIRTFISLLLYVLFILGTSWAVIASSISGGVLLLAILVVALVLIYVKLRNQTSTSRDDPEGNLETSLKKLTAAPRENAHTSTDSGLTQCEEDSAADSGQLEPNSHLIDETTVAIVSFFLELFAANI